MNTMTNLQAEELFWDKNLQSPPPPKQGGGEEQNPEVSVLTDMST